MTNRARFIAAALLLLAIFAPITAAFAEVPYLRWERGRVQEVVLGGVAATNNWKIQLQGAGVQSLDFKESSKAPGGFIVFSLMVPADAPVGPYTVVAVQPGGKIKVIAAVQMLGVETYTVTKVPRDLAFIIGIFIFLTAIASTLRAQKYALLTFASTQRFPESTDEQSLFKNIGRRIASAPYTMRTKAIGGFQTSLFKFLMLRQGELVHRMSKQLYAFIPIVGFVGGIVASNETQKVGGIAKASLAVFIAMALIGILDAYSGLLAVCGFWFWELTHGNVTSVRDILLMLAVGIGWLGPILALAIFQVAVPKDFARKGSAPSAAAEFIAIFTGALFGAAMFYLGHKLVNSILIVIKAQRNISMTALVIIAVALLVRGVADQAILGRDGGDGSKSRKPIETLTIARVNSSQSAIAVFVIAYGFSFLWTDSSQSSVTVAALFSAPFFLLLIRFNKMRIKALSRVPRNILLEGLVITAIAFYIFKEVSTLPLLADARAKKFILLAGMPGIIHAVYSVICDSFNRTEIMDS